MPRLCPAEVLLANCGVGRIFTLGFFLRIAWVREVDGMVLG